MLHVSYTVKIPKTFYVNYTFACKNDLIVFDKKYKKFVFEN